MICNGCKHLDRRHGECMELRHRVICGQCLSTYPITDIRCPNCHIVSHVEAGRLMQRHDDYLQSAYCPLSRDEQKKLKAKQETPETAVRQRGLF